jgi:hypothetical protein
VNAIEEAFELDQRKAGGDNPDDEIWLRPSHLDDFRLGLEPTVVADVGEPVEPGPGQHLGMGQPALPHLDPFAVVENVDLAAVEGVGVAMSRTCCMACGPADGSVRSRSARSRSSRAGERWVGMTDS